MAKDVILASRTSYPVALMIGFTCYGNVLLRKESGDKQYPSWIFGWLLGMVCYTYPGAIFSDLMFVSNAPQRALSNDNILWCFSFWYLVVQNSDAAYKFLQQKHVFVWLTTWWLADATRASLLFLERAVAEQPVFARGVWQAFVWCGAGPVARLIEKSIRGHPVPSLDKVQPNSLNFLKFPLIAMFWNMIFYMCVLAFFTDCGFLSPEPKLDMVECAAAHEDFYGFCTYLPCVLHLCRAYWASLSLLFIEQCTLREVLLFSEMVSAWEHATNSSGNEGFDDSEGCVLTCCAASDWGVPMTSLPVI
eukprot:s2971_g4.t1